MPSKQKNEGKEILLFDFELFIGGQSGLSCRRSAVLSAIALATAEALAKADVSVAAYNTTTLVHIEPNAQGSARKIRKK
jgi:hypothetical protein